MTGKWAVYERRRRALANHLHPMQRRIVTTWRRVGRYENEKQARMGFNTRSHKARWGDQIRLVSPDGTEVARFTQENWR